MLLILEGIIMCFILLLVCVIGIANGPVGMVTLYEEDVQQRVMYYEQRLRYWMEYEKTCQLNWAGFLKK
jgi:hypothetical protein